MGSIHPVSKICDNGQGRVRFYRVGDGEDVILRGKDSFPPPKPWGVPFDTRDVQGHMYSTPPERKDYLSRATWTHSIWGCIAVSNFAFMVNGQLDEPEIIPFRGSPQGCPSPTYS